MGRRGFPRHAGSPTFAPTATCDRTPLRFLRRSRPPDADAPPPDATPLLTPRPPRFDTKRGSQDRNDVLPLDHLRNRNDLLRVHDLNDRNDVLLFTTERCPAGRQLLFRLACEYLGRSG